MVRVWATAFVFVFLFLLITGKLVFFRDYAEISAKSGQNLKFSVT